LGLAVLFWSAVTFSLFKDSNAAYTISKCQNISIPYIVRGDYIGDYYYNNTGHCLMARTVVICSSFGIIAGILHFAAFILVGT